MNTWQQLRSAHAAECASAGHASLCAAARRLMPGMPDEDARACRVAMLSGDSDALIPLIRKHWKDR